MAHNTEQIGFPALPLTAGMIFRIIAQSPTTDAEVAGVTATRWTIYGYDESEGAPEPATPVEWLSIPTGG